jgi:hypothetical protein
MPKSKKTLNFSYRHIFSPSNLERKRKLLEFLKEKIKEKRQNRELQTLKAWQEKQAQIEHQLQQHEHSSKVLRKHNEAIDKLVRIRTSKDTQSIMIQLQQHSMEERVKHLEGHVKAISKEHIEQEVTRKTKGLKKSEVGKQKGEIYKKVKDTELLIYNFLKNHPEFKDNIHRIVNSEEKLKDKIEQIEKFVKSKTKTFTSRENRIIVKKTFRIEEDKTIISKEKTLMPKETKDNLDAINLFDEGMEILERMKNRKGDNRGDFRIETHIKREITKLLVIDKNWEEAESFVRKTHIGENYKYLEIIKGLIKNNMLEKAKEMINKSRNVNEQMLAYMEIAKASKSKKDWDFAIEFIGKQNSFYSGSEPDLYIKIIKNLMENNLEKEALMFVKFGSTNHLQRGMQTMANMLVNNNKISKARDLLKEVDPFPSSTNSWVRGAILIEIAKGTKSKEDLEIAKNMIVGTYGNNELLIKLAEVLAQTNEVAEAKNIAKSIQYYHSYLKCKTYMEIAKASKSKKDWSFVLKLIEDEKDWSFSSSKTKRTIESLKNEIYSDIIEGLIKENNLKMAESLIKEIKNDNLLKSLAYTSIAKASKDEKKWLIAKKLARNIDGPNQSYKNFVNIIKNMLEDGKRIMARALVREVDNDSIRRAGELELIKKNFNNGKQVYNKLNSRNLIESNVKEVFEIIMHNLNILRNNNADRKKIIDTLKNYGKLLPTREILNLEKRIPSDIKKLVQKIMISGRTSLRYALRSEQEELKEVYDYYSKRLIDNFKKGNKGIYLKESLRIINNLYKIGESRAQSLILDLANQYPEFAQKTYKMLEFMTGLESLKAKDFVLKTICQKKYPSRGTWLLIDKLIEEKYLNPNLKEFYLERLLNFEKGNSREQERELLIETTKLLVRENLIPDKALIEYILKDVKKIKQVEDKIKQIREKKKIFEQITEKNELIEFLSKEDNGFLHYIIYGGEYRYSLVNNFDIEKYLIFIKKVNELKIHEGPLKEFEESLVLPQEEKQAVMEKIRRGKYPFKGERTRKIYLSIEGVNLENIERRMGQVMGKNELGILFKVPVYAKLLESINKQLSNELKNMQGIGQTALIEQVEKKYPKVREEAKQITERILHKLEKKRILPFGTEAIFENSENRISVSQMLKNLENVRNDLIQALRNQAKSRSIDEITRDKRIEVLEEKANEKLIRYLLQDSLIEEGILKEGEFDNIFNEWESHIQKPISEFNTLKEKGEVKSENKEAIVRFLDKTEDVIPCARIGDSAQDCFSSKNYKIQWNKGASDWIAMLHKDPLSFHFQIELPKEDPSLPTEIIGFCFGSYGIEKGKPVVMLNGVYCDQIHHAQPVLDVIEEMLSRPLKVSKQLVASKYAANKKMPSDYSNQRINIKRLRALEENKKPIDVIYDDLQTDDKVNVEHETDKDIWWKKL